MTIWSEHFKEKLPDILAELKRYVELESPTTDKQSVDRLGQLIAEQFAALGAKVEIIEQSQYGNQLRIEYGQGDEQILVLGHFDTVKEVGTIEKEPWRIEQGKLFGPGVYDMKAGIVFAYFALKTIVEQNLSLNKKLVFFWNTDEEIGSHSSSEWIKQEAQRSTCTLVLEPAHGTGLLKTSRKGGGEFTLRVTGKAAHAGNDHASGINAIEELAHQIVAIQSWTDYSVGTTLSVGKISGGTASNVVPEWAEAVIDVRVKTAAEATKIAQRIAQLKPVLPGAVLSVSGGVDKMPMERTDGTVALFQHAAEQARLEGFQLGETSAGGTSDGNVAASVGAVVLDGLGPVGDGAHAAHEHILIDHIPERIALLLRLFTTL